MNYETGLASATNAQRQYNAQVGVAQPPQGESPNRAPTVIEAAIQTIEGQVERLEIIRPAVAMSRAIAFCREHGFRRCPQCGEVDSRTVLCGGILCVEFSPVMMSTGMRSRRRLAAKRTLRCRAVASMSWPHLPSAPTISCNTLPF